MQIRSLLKDPVVPENAPYFAAFTVKKVKELDEIDLDFSVDSLMHIDTILERFHTDGTTVDQVAVTLFSFGCYVGEVIVRNNPGAQWASLTEGEAESSLNSFLVVQLPSGSVVNPIGKVEKRLVNGESDSLAYFYYALVLKDAGIA